MQQPDLSQAQSNLTLRPLTLKNAYVEVQVKVLELQYYYLMGQCRACTVYYSHQEYLTNSLTNSLTNFLCSIFCFSNFLVLIIYTIAQSFQPFSSIFFVPLSLSHVSAVN